MITRHDVRRARLVELLAHPAHRWSYRRLLVFVVATALLLRGALTEGVWLAVALSFIVGETGERIARAAGQPTEPPAPARKVGF